MVTSGHEVAHWIFQERPELLASVFRLLDVPLPSRASVELLSPDATEMRPLERRIDSVLRVGPARGDESFLLAVEAQSRRDRDKPVSWGYYLAYLHSKFDLPALLLVVCQDKSTADWAAGPFRLGPRGWKALRVHPLVLGPNNTPVITDPEEAAADLPMAALSALTHGRDPDAPAILDALARALRNSSQRDSAYYALLLDMGLDGTPARQTWREMMDVPAYFRGHDTLVEQMLHEGEIKGEIKGKAKGTAEGKASSVLRVLDLRGVVVSDAIRQRVMACADVNTLDRWLGRALSVTDAEDLFVEGD